MSSPRPKFLDDREGSVVCLFSPKMPLKQKRAYKLEEILSHTSWPESLRTQRSGDHRKPNRIPPTALGGNRKGPLPSQETKFSLGAHPLSLQRDQYGWEGSTRCQGHTPLSPTPQPVAGAGADDIDRHHRSFWKDPSPSQHLTH
jgi:hypothetical protein